MSTVKYGLEDFANICAIMVRQHYDRGTAAELCELVSFTNTRAYNIRYREKTEPATAVQILAAMPAMPNARRAASDVSMIPYNCDGELNTLSRLEAMSALQSCIIRELMGREGR